MKNTIIENKTQEEVEAYQKALGRPGYFRWDMTPKQLRKHNAKWVWWSALMEEMCRANPCPWCGAAAGKPCLKRKEAGAHYGRRQLAGFRRYDGTNLMVRDGRAYRWTQVPEPRPSTITFEINVRES